MGEEQLLLGLNLAGIMVFSASGAAAAVAKRLDLFGVTVIGVVTALGGGVLRDVAINEAPPVAFTDWRYPVTAGLTAAVIFWLHSRVFRLRKTMLTLDAAGLGLFTVVGTVAALDAGIPQVGACMIGMITAIGGGVVRDLLTAEIPVVLLREIYAVASLAGTIVITVCHYFDVPPLWSSLGAAILVFGLRLISLQRNWSAPIAKGPAGALVPYRPGGGARRVKPGPRGRPASTAVPTCPPAARRAPRSGRFATVPPTGRRRGPGIRRGSR